MLLAVDIGNTNITIGIYKDNQLINNFRLTTRLQRTSDEYGIMITSFMNANHYPTNELHDVIISSVVPKINYSFSSSIIKYFHIHPIFIGPGIKTGISIRIDHPSSLGADRLVDAAGAYFTYGGPCLVIDFGTATTYDVITDKGEFIGGATAAGIGITANALSSMAAQLPEIEISRPEHLISKNTISSMQAGIVYGYIGQTEYIIDKIKKEYGENLKVRIDIYDNNLTFKGLKIIYDKNKNLLKK